MIFFLAVKFLWWFDLQQHRSHGYKKNYKLLIGEILSVYSHLTEKQGLAATQTLMHIGPTFTINSPVPLPNEFMENP